MNKIILSPLIFLSFVVVGVLLIQVKSEPEQIQQGQEPGPGQEASNTEQQEIQQEQEPINKPSVKIGDAIVLVEVVDTRELKVKGLSGRDSIEENQGMLFVYSEPSLPTFWMQGMRFDLDFIWIYENTIVDITKNVKAPSTDEELEEYLAKTEVDMVLEVNAGWVDRNSAFVGQEIELNI